jgi:hypothetical protein
MTITHEMELTALVGRYVEVTDPYGDVIAWRTLRAGNDVGRRFWRIGRWHHTSRSCSFELGDAVLLPGRRTATIVAE